MSAEPIVSNPRESEMNNDEIIPSPNENTVASDSLLVGCASGICNESVQSTSVNGNGNVRPTTSPSENKCMENVDSRSPSVAGIPSSNVTAVSTANNLRRVSNVHEKDSPEDVDMADLTLNDLPGETLASANDNVTSNNLPGENLASANDDVTTSDELLGETPASANDKGLPPWLGEMIEYLRGVSAIRAWQDLVTDYVEFEKGGPPNGVTFKLPSPIYKRSDIFVRKWQRNADQKKSLPGSGAKRRLLYPQSIQSDMEFSLWRGGEGCSRRGELV